MTEGRLRGRVALVTGASSGIGRTVAIGYAAAGATVVALARREPVLKELLAEIGPGDHRIVVADVTDEADVERALAQVRTWFGRLDVQFSCAGVQAVEDDTTVDLLEHRAWDVTVNTNLTGTFLVAKHATRLMLEAGRGSIITCGSPTALSGRGWRYHAYSASKGGVHALTRAMAAAYGPRGIRVNCVVPGTIDTSMTRLALDDAERAAELLNRTALRRIGTPEDIVGAAVFLASDESAYVTGAEIVVDGGLLLT